MLTDLLISLVLAFIASLPFPMNNTWRWIAILPVAAFLTLHLTKRRQNNLAHSLLHHYQSLLAFISSRLSVGETLERSFQASASGLGGKLPADSPFSRGLMQVERQIDAHSDLNSAITRMIRDLPCPNVQPILLVMPLLQRMGGRLDQFVRESHRMLVELSNLEQDSQAEQSQKLAEALVLALMPFVLSLGLNQMVSVSERQVLLESTLSQLIYCTAYCVACLALVWSWSLRQPYQANQNQRRSHRRSRSLPGTRVEIWLASALSKCYNLSRLAPYVQPIKESLATDQLIKDSFASYQLIREQYFLNKLRLMGLGQLLILFWVWSGTLPVYYLPLGPIGASLIQDIGLVQRRQRLVNRYRLDYPLFLNWQHILLRSGFSVAMVLQTGSTVWARENPNSVVGEDMLYFQQQSLGGRSCDWIAERLAERSPVPELQLFWNTVARYEREGGSDLLDLIALQAKSSYQLLRNGRKRELEEKGLMLLIPMMLDLLVVLLITVWPAASQLVH